MPFSAPSLGEVAKKPDQLIQLLQRVFTELETELEKADPVGRIVLWPAGVALPSGWVAADGSTYNKTKFPELYRRGEGTFVETATTFDVPNVAGAPAGTVYMIRVE